MSGHAYSQVSIITCMYQVQSTMSYIRFSFVINYVSEHRLSSTVGASHTTPTICANRAPLLLKLTGWRYCPCFRWVPYILGIMTQTPDVEPGCAARYYSNSVIVTVWDVSHPREPYSGILSRLRNLYPRSIQNTDIVSPINFSNPSISCLFILLFNLVKSVNIHTT